MEPKDQSEIKIKQDSLDPSGIVGCSYKTAEHALVDNFAEYQVLKEKENKFYNQSRRKVTAKSIMRHIRWKLGKISDKEFYEEEYNEAMQNEAVEAGSKFEIAKQKQAIEENLDTHFDRKRIEIQAEILRKKERKEKAS
jgi:hypothetical protein